MTRPCLNFRCTFSLCLLAGIAAFSHPVLGRVYDSVEVRGAEFVPEEDIRLTCGDLQGIELDDMQLRSVEDCLMSTGVFESVSVSGEDDALVIDVTEVESRPGRIDAGVAYVNDYGFAGTLAYEQFNLIPNAFLGVTSTYSRDYSSYSVNLYQKETFGPALHFGLDISGERASYSERSFSTRKDIAEAYLAWTPQVKTRLEFGLGYRDHRLFDLDAEASPLLQAERGKTHAPFLHVAVDYTRGTDKDDHSIAVRLDQYLWNIGTESRVAETRLDAQSRFALGDRTAVLFGLRAGLVQGLDGYQTTVLDRGFVGGETFRGFAPRGLGPSDANDFLGGNRHFVGSVELRRSLGEIGYSQIAGGAFADFGSVWGLDNTLGGTIDATARIRSSIGLSVTFHVAAVPVSLFVAMPVKYQPGDKRQVFGLSAAAKF